MTRKSLVVNLYFIGKMLYDVFTVQEVRNMMEAVYEIDKESKEFRNLTFEEYVDHKRNFTANILGALQYTDEKLA